MADPSVSLVIPIRNGPELIEKCLGSIAELRRSAGAFEVFIVDDASTDHTPDVAERWSDRLPLRVIRSERQRGPGASRNIGSEAARGEILGFIDGDCVADPAWLTDLLPAFDDPSVVAAGGAVVSAEERTWIQRYEGVCHPAQRGQVAGDVRPGTSNDFLAGCNILVRRSAFLSVGGFDATHPLGEDVDLIWRLATQAGRVQYRPDGIVAHHHVDRLGSLLRRRVALGSSEAVLFRRHPSHRRAFALSIPQAAVVLGVAGATAWRPWVASLPASALVADHIAGVRSARRRDRAVTHARVIRALFKAHASVAFRALSLIDRYYALPLSLAGVLVGLFWWPAFLIPPGLVAMSLGISVLEWLRLRPHLDPVRFAFVRTMDHIAVHLGIVAGCLFHRTLMPLRVRFGLAPWTIELIRHGHAGSSVEGDPLFAGSDAEPVVHHRRA
jgi:mycofactocin glycosyltransferase